MPLASAPQLGAQLTPELRVQPSWMKGVGRRRPGRAPPPCPGTEAVCCAGTGPTGGLQLPRLLGRAAVCTNPGTMGVKWRGISSS